MRCNPASAFQLLHSFTRSHLSHSLLMLFVYLFFLSAIAAAPVQIVTRVHTAAPVTTTNTYTTGTTTVWLPPVELFISNGVTYTFTLTDQPATVPTTTTSIYSSATQAKAETTPTNTAPAATLEANTPSPATQATPATTEATQANTETTQATTEANEATTSATTEATTSSTQATTEAQQATTEATTSSTTSSTSTSSTSTSTSSGIAAPWGIVYSPYADDGGCKDADTVASDLQQVSDKGIKHIRTYGTDCQSLSGVLTSAKMLGISVNQGLWMGESGVDSIDDSVSDLVDYIKDNGDDVFDFITIGNEAIINNYCTVSDLLAKLKSVKSTLQDAGYTGKITTAEPPVSFNNHPSLCDSNSPIDFVSINPHSYFNADIDASQAGSFIMTEKGLVEKSCALDVVITETGYPSKGDTNGLNIPSADNQAVALKSILEETGGDVTILTTFNDFWKQPGQYGIEQYFGALALFD